jgi:hypothetical protein
LVKTPVEATDEVSVTAPVEEFLLITLKPFSERTAPVNVVVAI